MTWTLPPQDSQGIDVRFSPAGNGELHVEVTSLDDDGAPRNFYRTMLRLVGPNLDPSQTTLEQVGPGRYAGTVRADEPGAYLVRVAQQRDGAEPASRTLGIVSPAAEEFRRLGVDGDALADYAQVGNGRELVPDPEQVDRVWNHDIPADAFPTPIWPWLLLLAMILVPIDVGVRRVALTRADAGRARSWLARRIGLGGVQPEPVAGLSELRAARQRSERRAERVAAPVATPVAPAPAPERAAAPRGAAGGPAAEPVVEGETLAERLARRRRGG